MLATFARFRFQVATRLATSALAVGTMACIATGAAAAGRTPAGTAIANTARVTYNGAPAGIASNTATVTVAELLDVSIVADRRAIEVASDAEIVPVGFRFTNEGNAAETFVLSARGATIAGIASDDDGDGLYDARKDRMLATPELELKAGASRRFFVLARDLPALGAQATVTATATARTGHGAAGTVFAGAGAGGVDAVVGRTGAEASAQTVLASGAGQPRLEKSSSVRAPDGSARIMPGALITWQLEASFPRATGEADLTDAIPAGTRFVPGSVTLDGRPLTDAADGDAGRFDGDAVHVALGGITAAVTRTIRFQTIIQ